MDAVQGLADSGELAGDVTDLMVALGEAARDQATGVVFLFDEIQFLSVLVQAWEALIAALHKTVQRALPVTLVGAGLPQIPRLVGEAKSYAERLFKFPVIGSLGAEEATEALVTPASTLDVRYAQDAAADIVAYTEGYPYFIQEYGKVIWDEAGTSPITLADVHGVRPLVEAKLDGSFFRVRARTHHRAGIALSASDGCARSRSSTGERGGPNPGQHRAPDGADPVAPYRQGPAVYPGIRPRRLHGPPVDCYLLRTYPPDANGLSAGRTEQPHTHCLARHAARASRRADVCAAAYSISTPPRRLPLRSIQIVISPAPGQPTT